MKNIALMILCMGFSFQAISAEENLSRQELFLLSYMNNEATELRLARSWAAEAIEHAICKDPEIKEDEDRHQSSLEGIAENKKEAEMGLKLSHAVGRYLNDKKTPSPRAETCKKQIKFLTDAIAMLERLKSEEYLDTETSTYFIDRYKSSLEFIKVGCR